MAFRDRRPSVVIVGGGPAGLAAACELARLSLGVTLVEKNGFASTRVGEHIGPAAVQRLRTMGLGDAVDPADHFACSGIDAWWGSPVPSHNDYLRHPVGFGLNLSRPRFDAALARLCRKRGARVLAPARVVRASHGPEGWELEIASGGRLMRRRPAYVVDASGRSFAFARTQGARSSAAEKQLAIIGIADGIAEPQLPSARVIVEATRTGWWYFAAIAEARCVCMLVTDPRLFIRAGESLDDWWRSQLENTTQVGRRYAAYARTGALLVRSAQSRRLEPFHGPDWIAIGDAAMSFDPLSSQGIAKAVEQGQEAAAAIGRLLGGETAAIDEYADALAARYADYLATRGAYYRLEQRWSDAEFWKARQ
jgi:flavin-dependent dehydrogenase